MKALYRQWFLTIYVIVIVATAYVVNTNGDFAHTVAAAFLAAALMLVPSIKPLHQIDQALEYDILLIASGTTAVTSLIGFLAESLLVTIPFFVGVMGWALYVALVAAQSADKSVYGTRRPFREIWWTNSGKLRMMIHLGIPLYIIFGILVITTDRLSGLAFLSFLPIFNMANEREIATLKKI